MRFSMLLTMILLQSLASIPSYAMDRKVCERLVDETDALFSLDLSKYKGYMGWDADYVKSLSHQQIESLELFMDRLRKDSSADFTLASKTMDFLKQRRTLVGDAKEQSDLASLVINAIAANASSEALYSQKVKTYHQKRREFGYARTDVNPEIEGLKKELTPYFDVQSSTNHIIQQSLQKIFDEPASQTEIDPILDAIVTAAESGRLHEWDVSLDHLFHSSSARNYIGGKVETFEDAGYKKVSSLAAKLMEAHPDGSYSKKVEALYLGFISSRIQSMKYAEKMLGEGWGFHHAMDVKERAKEAVRAVEDLMTLIKTRSNLTANIDLELLKTMFIGLQYDNSGRRKFGDGISVSEVFGINGEQRGDKLLNDPYVAIDRVIGEPVRPRPKALVKTNAKPEDTLEIKKTNRVLAFFKKLFQSIFKKKIDTEAFKTFVQNEVARLGELSEEELSLLGRVQTVTGDEASALSALSGYRGPRSELAKNLLWHVERLESDAKGDFSIENWIQFPELEEIQGIWAKYKSEGWSAVATRNAIKRDSISAIVETDKKLIRFRLVIRDEPIPLTAAEEILHVEAMDLIWKHGTSLDYWVRKRIARVLLEKDLLVDGFTWAQAQNQRALEKYLDIIPGTLVEQIKLYLIERDAMYKKLELYEKLAKNHPEFKSDFWEKVRISQNPKAKMESALNEVRFHLSSEVLKALGSDSLKDIVQSVARGESDSNQP